MFVPQYILYIVQILSDSAEYIRYIKAHIKGRRRGAVSDYSVMGHAGRTAETAECTHEFLACKPV